MTGSVAPTVPPPPREPGIPGPPPASHRRELRWSHLEGTEVAVKVAAGTERARLRREAEVLRRLEETRVPRVLEVVEAADHTELVMERHGALTLADATLIDLAERRTALVGLCTALGELHDAGWAHGRVEPRHVLVSPRGRVRLCSLGEAVELAAGGPEALAGDLADLSATVVEVLDAEATFQSSYGRWRWNRAARRARRRIATTRGMLSPAAMADLCAEALPSAGGSRPVRPRRRRLRGERPRGEGRRRRAPMTVLGALVLLASAVAVLGALLGGVIGRSGDGRGTDRDRPSVVSGPGARTNDTTTDTARTSTPPSGAASAQSAPGDGTLVVDGVRFKVAEPGDVVVVGDWNCDGLATPAVFRPSTGSVFAYDTWASDGAPTSAHTLGRAPGAAGIRPAEACGAPRVEWADGTLHPLEENP